MSLATNGRMSKKWQNSAARLRCQRKAKAALCRILGWPTDVVYSYGDLRQEILNRGLAHDRSVNAAVFYTTKPTETPLRITPAL